MNAAAVLSRLQTADLAGLPLLLRDLPIGVDLAGPGPRDYAAVPRGVLHELKRAGLIRLYGWKDGYWLWGLDTDYRFRRASASA